MTDRIRVLYVDDDVSSLEIRAEILEEDHGFDMVTAVDVEAAKDRLEESRIDCVLSDLEMPEQDGFDFLEYVREEYPNLPFILFTAHESEEVANRAIEAGATDYFPKSIINISYELLAHRIRQAVAQYRHLEDDRVLTVSETADVSTSGSTETVDEDDRPGEPEGSQEFQWLDRSANEFQWLDDEPTEPEPSAVTGGFRWIDSEDSEPKRTADSTPDRSSDQLDALVQSIFEDETGTDEGKEHTQSKQDVGNGEDPVFRFVESALGLGTLPSDQPTLPESSAVASESPAVAQEPKTPTSGAEQPVTRSSSQNEAARPRVFHVWGPQNGGRRAEPDQIGEMRAESDSTAVDARPETDTEPEHTIDTEPIEKEEPIEAALGVDTSSPEPEPESAPEPKSEPEPEPEFEPQPTGWESADEYDRPEGLSLGAGDSVLLQCGAQDDREHTACVDLLGVEDVTDQHVLLIRYRQMDEARLERIATNAERLKVVSIGYAQPIPQSVREEVETVQINNPNDLTRLGIVVTGTVNNWNESGADITVCHHSVNVLLQYKNTQSVFRFLHIFLGKLRSAGAASHFHVDPTAGDPQAVNTLKPLFDSVVTIDSVGVHLEQ